MNDLTGYARSVASAIDRASVLLAWLSVGAITAMMVVTGADVFLRYFGRGVMGIVEFVGNYLMVAVVFLPLAYGMTKEGHITVDFLVSRLNKRLKTSLESLGLLCSLFAYSLVFWFGASGAIHAWKSGDTMVNVGLPMWPGKALVPLGALLLCLQILRSICRNLAVLFDRSSALNESRE